MDVGQGRVLKDDGKEWEFTFAPVSDSMIREFGSRATKGRVAEIHLVEENYSTYKNEQEGIVLMDEGCIEWTHCGPWWRETPAITALLAAMETVDKEALQATIQSSSSAPKPFLDRAKRRLKDVEAFWEELRRVENPEDESESSDSSDESESAEEEEKDDVQGSP